MSDGRSDIEQAMQVFLRMLSGDDPAQMLRESEVHKGFTIVPVGSVPWFPEAHWGERDVVSTDGIEVRIVAIGAKWPGRGALNRLLDGIIEAGLRPVIICPLATMETILRRWGWRSREIGVEFDEREEQWRPPPGWRARTEASVPVSAGAPIKASAAAGGAGRGPHGGKDGSEEDRPA